MSGGILIEVIEQGGSVIVEEVVVKVVEVYDFTIAGDVIPGSLGTTKGDMIVFAAAGDPRRLPAGANGTFIKYDSGQALGVTSGVPASSGLNTFTNNSGGNLGKGAVVVWDTAADNAFKTSVTEGDETVCGVLAEAINSYASGLVATGGTIETNVLVSGNVTRGNWLIQSTTAGRLKDSGSAIPVSGAIAKAMTGYAGGGSGTVTAFIGSHEYSATETGEGLIELATNAETITGTDNTRAVHPAGLQAKVSSETALGIVELATTTEAATGTDTTRAITAAGLKAGALAFIASQFWLSGSGGWPSTTAGCADPAKTEMPTNKVNIKTADFDQTTQEHFEWTFAMPGDYGGGSVTAKFHWTANSTSTNSVIWGLQARCFADDDALDQAFGTAQEVTDANKATAYDLNITAETAAITIGGTPAAGKLIHWRAYRKAADGSDNLAVDAKLIGVQITYTRS